MKAFQFLALAALGSAFVLPDQEIMSSEAVQNTKSPFQSLVEELPSPSEAWSHFDHSLADAFGCAKHKFSDAVDYTLDVASEFGQRFEEQFDHKSWLETTEDTIDAWTEPPQVASDRPHHKRPHHKRPHHHKPNQTVYELIAGSKYTTILAKLISEYPDLIEALNGTAANYTVFAPTDKAFKKVPKDAPKPSKEDLKKILTYHVSPEFYPAGRVLVTRTIPTALKAPELGDEPQRLSTQVSLKGLTVNFYARIVAVDIFGTNGVIHGVDSILLPPPKVTTIIELLPSEFSTFSLALYKTGLLDSDKPTPHVGGTLFAPSNTAFERLGPKINAFLFSKYGEKYLKALLLYHVSLNFTLYSDAFYKGADSAIDAQGRIPKGRYHIDLPTGLKGKSLAVDIARFGRFIEIKINGYNRVAVPDGIAKDGVIHVVNSVLIPPKKPGAGSEEANENMSVEEFMDRLEPLVEDVIGKDDIAVDWQVVHKNEVVDEDQYEL